MPMYYFDVLERDGTVNHDLVGVEMRDHDQALDAASQTLMDVLHDSAMQHPDFKVQIVVRDEHGEEIGRRDAQIRRSDSPG